jgi:hypothetical protein
VCVAQCTSRMSTNSVSSVDLGESLTQVRFLPIFEYLMCMRGRAYIHVAHIPINKVSELSQRAVFATVVYALWACGSASDTAPVCCGSLEDGL